jgi:hypothetical protein
MQYFLQKLKNQSSKMFALLQMTISIYKIQEENWDIKQGAYFERKREYVYDKNIFSNIFFPQQEVNSHVFPEGMI